MGDSKPIRLLHQVSTQDSAGRWSIPTETRYNRWAEVVKTGFGRVETAGKSELLNTAEFKVRFQPEWKINGDWFIIYLGKRYTITAIERIEEQRFNWRIKANG